MYKKIVALFMAMILAVGTSMTAFASTTSSEEGEWVLVNSESVEIEVNGQIVEIPVMEYNFVNPNGTDVQGMYPEYEVGEPKRFQIPLTNQQMGLPSYIATPIALTNAIKKNTTKILEDVITKKLGPKFIPGLSIATILLSAIAWKNADMGYDGFIFTIDLEYSSIFLHKEGYYVYGWDITSASMKQATQEEIDDLK